MASMLAGRVYHSSGGEGNKARLRLRLPILCFLFLGKKAYMEIIHRKKRQIRLFLGRIMSCNNYYAKKSSELPYCMKLWCHPTAIKLRALEKASENG